MGGAMADVSMDNSISMSIHVRNLVHETFPVFEALAKRSRTTHPAELRPHVLAACNQYRLAMRKCANEMDMKQLEEEADLIHVVKASLALLHLCEIVYLDSSHDTVLAYAFGEWIQEHYGAMDMEDMEATFFRLQTQLGSTIVGDLPDTYWPTIVQLILAGHGRKAWELLSLYSHANYSLEQLEPVRNVLINMPFQYHRHRQDLPSWPAWHEACLALNQSDLTKDVHFKMIFQLLLNGSEAANAQPWYLHTAARCVLSDPKTHLSRTAQCLRLVHHLHAALAPEVLGPFEQIVVSLLELDLGNALDAIQQLSTGSFPYFPAHLMDLLSHAGHVERNEAFILSYVDSLMHSEDPNVNLLVGYLETCPANGGPVLLSLLESQSEACTTDFIAEKLILLGQFYGLAQYIAKIALERGAYWESKERWGTAMTWYLRAQDATSINTLCEKSWFAPTNLLHQVADVLVASHQTNATAVTAFTTAYHELVLVFSDCAKLAESHHPALAQVQQEAAKRIGKICRECDIPTSMWPSVLALVDQLLPLNPPVFTSSDLYAILQAIQDQKLRFCRITEIKKRGEGAAVAASIGVQKQIALCLAKALVLDV
ncbi:nucleoporin NUP85 [Thraustotheca clavata]|uniref:Nuclear pore complex protein Nup85 n=1 Tax=Thraustotheca clavata TaxID=74557 RepID=A0A1V9ZQY2_9STRA|nr:nucleoporin NUP85 [Thraustotheca clavata]